MESERRQGGRPRKNATEKKKYVMPPVRMQTKDYYLVKARAKQAGVSLTEYQRQCILQGYVLERLSPEMLDLYHQLAGIGNNLNQLAHQANALGYEHDRDIFHNCAMQVAELIRHILYGSKHNERQ